MAERGYERASISDVAKEAGLKSGLVHYHYPSKLEILLDLVERLAKNHGRRLDEAVDAAGPDPIDALDAVIDGCLAIDRANPDALAVWTALGGETLKEPEVQKRFEAAMRTLRDRLRDILRRAGVKKTETVAAAIVAAIQGYLVLGVTTDLVPSNTAAPCVKKMARGLLTEDR